MMAPRRVNSSIPTKPHLPTLSELRRSRRSPAQLLLLHATMARDAMDEDEDGGAVRSAEGRVYKFCTVGFVGAPRQCFRPPIPHQSLIGRSFFFTIRVPVHKLVAILPPTKSLESPKVGEAHPPVGSAGRSLGAAQRAQHEDAEQKLCQRICRGGGGVEPWRRRSDGARAGNAGQ